jgi:hypothetical protein
MEVQPSILYTHTHTHTHAEGGGDIYTKYHTKYHFLKGKLRRLNFADRSAEIETFTIIDIKTIDLNDLVTWN